MEKFTGLQLKPSVLALALLLGQFLAPALTLANPTGGTVAAGSATISSSGKTLTIQQNSPQAIINWQSFSNVAGEAVKFNQLNASGNPDPSAVVLNRVTGTTPSSIYGSLSGNGSVFLLNPNGFIFGPNSQVNIGGTFLAATHTLADSDFLNKKYKFQDSGKGREILTYGSINAGQVDLFGASDLEISGQINTNGGKVNLVEGQQFSLDPNGLITMVMPAKSTGAFIFVGDINAGNGKLEIDSDGDVYLGGLGLLQGSTVSITANGNIAGGCIHHPCFSPTNPAIIANTANLTANTGDIGASDNFLFLQASNINANAPTSVTPPYTQTPGNIWIYNNGNGTGTANVNLVAGNYINFQDNGSMTGSASAPTVALMAFTGSIGNLDPTGTSWAQFSLDTANFYGVSNGDINAENIHVGYSATAPLSLNKVTARNGSINLETRGDLSVGGDVSAPNGSVTLSTSKAITGVGTITGKKVSLYATGGIGTLNSPIQMNTTSFLAQGDSVYAANSGKTLLTLNDVIDYSNVAISSAGDIEVGTELYGGHGNISLNAGGSILSNGNINSVIVGNSANLVAGGFIGTLLNPLSVSLNGSLTAKAAGTSDGNTAMSIYGRWKGGSFGYNAFQDAIYLNGQCFGNCPPSPSAKPAAVKH